MWAVYNLITNTPLHGPLKTSKTVVDFLDHMRNTGIVKEGEKEILWSNSCPSLHPKLLEIYHEKGYPVPKSCETGGKSFFLLLSIIEITMSEGSIDIGRLAPPLSRAMKKNEFTVIEMETNSVMENPTFVLALPETGSGLDILDTRIPNYKIIGCLVQARGDTFLRKQWRPLKDRMPRLGRVAGSIAEGSQNVLDRAWSPQHDHQMSIVNCSAGRMPDFYICDSNLGAVMISESKKACIRVDDLKTLSVGRDETTYDAFEVRLVVLQREDVQGRVGTAQASDDILRLRR